MPSSPPGAGVRVDVDVERLDREAHGAAPGVLDGGVDLEREDHVGALDARREAGQVERAGGEDGVRRVGVGTGPGVVAGRVLDLESDLHVGDVGDLDGAGCRCRQEVRLEPAEGDPVTGLEGPEDARAHDSMLIGHGSELARLGGELQRFLHERFYRHPRLQELTEHARVVLGALFARYLETPDEMAPWYGAWAEEVGRARAVCDHVAGMTDRFAEAEYVRLVGPLPTSNLSNA